MEALSDAEEEKKQVKKMYVHGLDIYIHNNQRQSLEGRKQECIEKAAENELQRKSVKTGC